MDKSTSVSIRANRPYIQALLVIAKRRKLKVADLVRQTLDKELGNELSPLSTFFETSVNELGRLTEKMDEAQS
jgi:predicted DNA-binding ribbon-helix-helix protein